MDRMNRKGSCLQKTMIALGFIGTMAAANATPSLAQGVYFEGPGFGVGVGRPAYRDRDCTARTVMSLGTVTATTAEPLLSAMTGVFAE
jgi:hypothetical protein